MKLAFTALVTLLCVACSSQQQAENEDFAETPTIDRNIRRDNTSANYKDTLAGAAIRQGGYRHVLGERNFEDISEVSTTTALEDDPIEISEQVLRSYSIYEMQRWARFCGEGKMDSRDWDFIAKEGRDNLPETLKASCSQPTFNRDDYRSAWKASCDNGVTDKREDRIRELTIRPTNICES